MKPNGRRRWRRLARKHRQQCAHDAMRAVYSVSQAMKDRRTGYELKPLPPQVFSPRSLVGMTRGARKRLRDRVVWGTRHDGIEPQVLRVAHAAECSVSEVLGLPEMGMVDDAQVNAGKALAVEPAAPID